MLSIFEVRVYLFAAILFFFFNVSVCMHELVCLIIFVRIILNGLLIMVVIAERNVSETFLNASFEQDGLIEFGYVNTLQQAELINVWFYVLSVDDNDEENYSMH